MRSAQFRQGSWSRWWHHNPNSGGQLWSPRVAVSVIWVGRMKLDYTPYAAVASIIRAAINNGRRISMVRLGDGELTILRWRNEDPGRVDHVLRRAFGLTNFTAADKDAVREELH